MDTQPVPPCKCDIHLITDASRTDAIRCIGHGTDCPCSEQITSKELTAQGLAKYKTWALQNGYHNNGAVIIPDEKILQAFLKNHAVNLQITKDITNGVWTLTNGKETLATDKSLVNILWAPVKEILEQTI